MRPVGAWRRLMSSTLTVAPLTGRSADGSGVYGAPVTYRAHLARRPRLVMTAQQVQVVSSLQAFLDAAPAILPTAQVTLSTGDVGSTQPTALHPPILAVEQRFDQTGPHSTVLSM